MVAHMTDAEVNAALAAMMNDDDDDSSLPPVEKLSIDANQAAAPPTAAARTIGVPPPPRADGTGLSPQDEEALLRAAMDDNWDGSAGRGIGAVGLHAMDEETSPVTSSNSMGYLSLAPADAAALIPGAPSHPPESADPRYCLPALGEDDDRDEFMFPTDGSDLAPEQILAKTHAALAALAASDVHLASGSAGESATHAATEAGGVDFEGAVDEAAIAGGDHDRVQRMR